MSARTSGWVSGQSITVHLFVQNDTDARAVAQDDGDGRSAALVTEAGPRVRRLVVGLLLTVPLALSACGTTTPLSQQVSAAGGGSGLDGGSTQDPSGLGTTGGVSTPGGSAGLGTTGGGGTTSGSGSTGSTGSSGPGSTSTSGSAGGGSTGGTSGSSTGGPNSSAAPTSQGRGVTSSTITIGVAAATGTGSLGSTFGVSGGGTASTKSIVETVVKDVNKSGGILGRQLKVYVHEFDAAQGIANPDKTIAEICEDFRNDHKVFAVAFDVVLPALRQCTAQMGSPLLVLGGATLIPASAYTQNGGNYLYGVDALTTDRLAELFTKSLVDRTFFQKWNIATGKPGSAPVKLGVIHVDNPDQNALYAGYARELAKYGMKFTDTITYSQDAATALASTQNAVLKFRADGITHVFGASAFFFRDADSQNYIPRYAYLPGLGKLGADNSPARQLQGALTVGWTPSKDVGAAQDPGASPAGKRCRALMVAAGFSTSDRSDLGTMYAVCDMVYSLRAALTAGKAPTVAGLRAGFDALGSSYVPALTFSTGFGPTRHYGNNSVRDMAYDSGCKCLKYTSTTNRS